MSCVAVYNGIPWELVLELKGGHSTLKNGLPLFIKTDCVLTYDPSLVMEMSAYIYKAAFKDISKCTVLMSPNWNNPNAHQQYGRCFTRWSTICSSEKNEIYPHART